jgi:dethiobiotin synthetase
MGRNFLIASTGFRAGKSLVACALGFAFRARGLRVGVMKPVAVGCDLAGGTPDPADIRGVALASGCTLALDMICPYRYVSPLAPPAAAHADGLPPPDFARIEHCYRQIAAASDVVIVEAVGGIAEPLSWETDTADLAARLGLGAIIVVANQVGCVGAARLAVLHARARGVEVAGLILNDAAPGAPDSATVARVVERGADAPILGAMRFREPLALSVVEKLLKSRG